MIYFKSISQYQSGDKLDCYVVINPLRSDANVWCFDYSFLIGMVVCIDGYQQEVVAVEKFAYAGQRRVNEPISLCVRALKKEE